MEHLRMKVKIQILLLSSYVRYLKLVLVLRTFALLNFKVQFAALNSLKNKTYSDFLEYFVILVVLVGFPWTSQWFSYPEQNYAQQKVREATR